MVDTAVLIDDLRDQAEAVAFLEGCGQPLALFGGEWRRQYGRRQGTGLAELLVPYDKP
jgi:hypothetical protein